MNILQQDDEKRGSFYYDEEGKRIAEMTYEWNGNMIININHTEVHEELKGKGVGKLLVERAVEFAREKGLKITATCQFAKKVLGEDEQYKDVFK